MANLTYRIRISEEEIDENGDVINEINTNLPHHDIIKDWFCEEWNTMNPIQYADKDIKDNIISAKMKIFKNKENETIAVITVIPISGYRWSSNRRNKIWEELDAQMSDGFGECFDRYLIPGTNNFHLML